MDIEVTEETSTQDGAAVQTEVRHCRPVTQAYTVRQITCSIMSRSTSISGHACGQAGSVIVNVKRAEWPAKTVVITEFQH